MDPLTGKGIIMQKHWIGVASADHVAHRKADGFMQVCHGKAAPLARIKPADGVIYYSPTQAFMVLTGCNPSPLSALRAIMRLIRWIWSRALRPAAVMWLGPMPRTAQSARCFKALI